MKCDKCGAENSCIFCMMDNVPFGTKEETKSESSSIRECFFKLRIDKEMRELRKTLMENYEKEVNIIISAVVKAMDRLILSSNEITKTKKTT